MANPAGTPIWYELMTPDPDGAKVFYDDVVGWTVEAPPPGAVDYRMIAAPGGHVGGILQLTEDMRAGGAHPAWLLYVGVQDVDGTAQQAKDLGAQVLIPPSDIAGVGRFSFLVDPQGAPFYVMRGGGEQTSTVFAPKEAGRCGWNELWSTDVSAALAFYGALFGWANRETMDMGAMGGYHFIDLGEVRLGAAVEIKDRPAGWNLYFNVADIDRAVERIRAGGGVVTMGPHAVPTGDRIVLGSDPQGAAFALVAPAAG